MKKNILSVVLSFSICFPIILIAQSQSGSKRIRVIVDERIELITTMQLLYDYPLVGKADIRYKAEVLSYFAKHKNDTSVNYFLNIAEKYLSFVRPINYAYHFTFPAFKQNAGFTNYENENYGFASHSADSLKLYIGALKQFYKESHFHDFYTAHRRFYDSVITVVRRKIDSVDLTAILENHYGVKQHVYTLVLSPLFIEAGMSTWVKAKQGNDLYSVIGPNLDSKSVPDFDPRWLMQFLVFHEFSHPFCNPVVDKYYGALEKDTCLLQPIKKQMARQGNKSWKTVLYEMLTRANEICLVKQVFGKADADKVYNNYLQQKYLYLTGLVPIVEDYDNNRSRYKTLDNIMPRVIRYFDDEAAKCKQ